MTEEEFGHNDYSDEEVVVSMILSTILMMLNGHPILTGHLIQYRDDQERMNQVSANVMRIVGRRLIQHANEVNPNES